MSDEILATIHPSAARRGFGIAALAILGAMLIYLGFSAPATFVFKLILLGFGGLALLGGEALRRATANRLELTETDLRDSTGRILAKVAQIERVDRGAFAFKPSNGFLLKLSASGPRGWAPGLWWRIGSRIGVGGVTSAAQTKAMAEIISAMILQREAGD